MSWFQPPPPPLPPSFRRFQTIIKVSMKHGLRPKSLRSRLRELEGRCGWQSADTLGKRLFFLRRIVLKDKRVTKPGSGAEMVLNLTYRDNPFMKIVADPRCPPDRAYLVQRTTRSALLYGSAAVKITGPE